MTTVAYSSPIGYSTTAQLRAWVLELHNALIAAGMVQHTDTGQVDPTTMTLAAVNVSSGYKIYRFNDSLQATAPIYIKLEFGLVGNATTPGCWLTVGTGTNGSGTINGLSITRVAIVLQVQILSETRPFLTNICVQDGYLAVLHKRQSLGLTTGSNDVNFAFVVSRTVDDAGALTAEGVRVAYTQATTSAAMAAVTLKFSTSYNSGASVNWIAKYGAVASAYHGAGVIGIFKGVGSLPRVYIDPFIVGYLRTELINNSTFSFAAVGGVSRTYLAVGDNISHMGFGGTNGTDGLAIVYS
jgi:hypothetical protein